MLTITDVRDIFTIFHDGVISAWAGNRKVLTLTVDCEYLAERINRSYSRFYIELSNIDKIEFDAWNIPGGLPNDKKTSISGIFETELEILSADIKDDEVIVSCMQYNKSFNYSGGILIIRCSKVRVFDDGMEQIALEKLKDISKEYWDEL